MKKSIALLLVFILTISSVFVACSSKGTEETSTKEGLEAKQDELGFEYIEVTDENGKSVTDKNGKNVTTEVAVKYEKDKNGKTIAKVIGDDGEVVTDKNGKDVTVDTEYQIEDPTENTEDNSKIPTTEKNTTTQSTTVTTKKNEETTEKDITTIDSKKDKVPSTYAKGEIVTFSSDDQQTIKNMLEVPYLYLSSYENSDGVPIDIAAHAAMWMAEREGLKTSTYASGTIVLDLFKYFGQTVVNFKSKCNEDAKNTNISYNSNNDTFKIKDFENPTHTVTIQKIEDLGNNNYYRVTASVSGTNKAKKVYAIFQRNKLDSTLGFSIKALRWK